MTTPTLPHRQCSVFDWSTLRESLFRRLAEMSALFQQRPPAQNAGEKWTRIADSRTAPTAVRLRAGLFIRYSKATGAKEFDTLNRDAKTWAAFENAALPELNNFTFVNPSRQVTVSASAALADAMYHVWTVTDSGRDLDGRPTTISVVNELANYLCAVYETKPIDPRARKHNWFGLSPSS